MKFSKTTVLATLALSGAVFATAAYAGGKSVGGNGASLGSPGHQMQSAQSATTSTGPGASEYAPGDVKHDNSTFTPPGKSTEPGASGFAPGDAISDAISKDKK